MRPAAIVLLRRRAAAQDPAAWAALPTNGPYAALSPALVNSRAFDESSYAARANQVLLHGRPVTPYWREFRAFKDWANELLPFYPLAAVGALCGGNWNAAWALLVALGAAGWFWLWFSLFKWGSGRDEAAAPLALFLTLFPDFCTWLLDVNLNPHETLSRWGSVFFQSGSMLLPHWHRLYSLHLTVLALGALLVALWRLSTDPRPRFAASGLLGLALGSMVLVHPFEFAMAMACLALFPVLVEAHARTGKASVGLQDRGNLWLALGGGLLACVAYGVLNRLLRTPEDYAIVLRLTHAVPSRRLHPMTIVHLALAFWCWTRARRAAEPARASAWLLLASGQLAAFSWRNAELVLGHDIQFFHVIPISGALGAAALGLGLAETFGRREAWTARRALLACGLLAALAGARELTGARRQYRMLGLNSDTAAAYAWLNAHAPKDALLLSASMLVNAEAPLYTAVKTEAPPLTAPMAVLFTRDYYLERVARLLKTLHVDVKRFGEERLPASEEKAAINLRAYAAVSRAGAVDWDELESLLWFYGDAEGSDPIATRKVLAEDYAKAEPIAPPFYVWVGPQDRPLLSMNPERWGAAPVFTSGGVTLYEYRR